MTKLSFTTSDFKLIPVSEAYTPGRPARGTVPLRQHVLVLLLTKWESFFWNGPDPVIPIDLS